MKRVLLQSAYVLHRRPYRESSFLVDLFTLEHGRMTVVASGVRKTKSSTQGILQPFIPLLVSWSGKGELMTLVHVEANGHVQRLSGECLFAGFYLNELLMSLLQKWDAHPDLYRVYAKTLIVLQAPTLEEKTLRSFEKYLLEELGYGMLPKSDISLHNTFVPEKYYRFIPELGFVLSELDGQMNTTSNIFSGKSLIAMAKDDWGDTVNLQDAKRLMRFVLAPLLGTRLIYSRQLFVQPEGKHEESCKK
jgi:DNA repair protein RecO (recombination protein O)